MNTTCDCPASSRDSMGSGEKPSIRLIVITGDHVPSFKNSKRSILDRNTGKQRTLTPGKIKKRMQLLEEAILSGLYSVCPIKDGGTDLECLRRLRTALSALYDDSLGEIPQSSFAVNYVPKGDEGVEIIIEKL